MSEQSSRRMNMSDDKGAFECACRQPAVYGSSPADDCPHCDGTGYTNDPEQKKDWVTNPPPEMDY